MTPPETNIIILLSKDFSRQKPIWGVMVNLGLTEKISLVFVFDINKLRKVLVVMKEV